MMIDVHPAVGEPALQREAIKSLKANRIDPKFHYVTQKQADLWRQVFLKHSPIHGNLEFVRIYCEAFARVIDPLSAEEILLVGLGCGTGAKEFELATTLKRHKRSIVFSAIDVSRDLVEESAKKLAAAGADCRRSLVCDLNQPAYLEEWLGRRDSDLPRLLTFFGLVPNFAPSMVSRIFKAVLRHGDMLLVSAHLAPIEAGDSADVNRAMVSVLSQYDNPETLAWINALLEYWGLADRLSSPEMIVGEIEGIPAFLAQARWKTNEPFEKWGHRVMPKAEEPLQLFHSLRYTPGLFEDFLRREGFASELLSITACKQEAIWLVRR